MSLSLIKVNFEKFECTKDANDNLISPNTHFNANLMYHSFKIYEIGN